jgi:hypothetical protein
MSFFINFFSIHPGFLFFIQQSILFEKGQFNDDLAGAQEQKQVKYRFDTQSITKLRVVIA